MTTDITIRNASDEELDEAAGVMVAAYEEFASDLGRESWEEYRLSILDVRSRLGESELMVAEQEGRIVGAVTFYPLGIRLDSPWPPDWTGIRLVAVLPSSRGRGIGKMLVEECIRRSQLQGAAAVGLHSMPMMKPAQRLYERMGFARAYEFEAEPPSGGGARAYKWRIRG